MLVLRHPAMRAALGHRNRHATGCRRQGSVQLTDLLGDWGTGGRARRRNSRIRRRSPSGLPARVL